ncbi:serine/threonine protein kinase Ckk4 [Rhodotorula toruloides]|uniref:Serine/threonine protein kinase Ckk4 n=1 Tax=Rhodotorula toruloides TaxID=5286 RepID=A0A511KKK3_RHOTO|nr:serine/threonine protein kinase Ckk4 [Rhodotorula toruloides]
MKTGEFAAIKKVAHLPPDHRHANDLLREVTAMKIVSHHPHILELLDVFETDTHHYLIMEYCPDGELFHYLHEHVLASSQVQHVFGQLVNALVHLARFRLCHRDIKLENILIRSDVSGYLNIKLIDFGMVAYQGEGELLTESCGSPHYAAPEVIMGESYNGFLADVWSAGVVLFALLTRSLPFDADNIPAVLAKVKKGEYELPDIVEEPAHDLVNRCLTVTPSERITLHGIVAHRYFSLTPSASNPLAIPSIHPSAVPFVPYLAYEQDALEPDILENLAMLVRTGHLEQLVRSNEGEARLFYSILLAFSQPHLAVKPNVSTLPFMLADRPLFTPSDTDASPSTHRSLSAPNSFYQGAPSIINIDATSFTKVSSPSTRSLQATSTLSREQEWGRLNREYIFPPPPKPGDPVVTTDAPDAPELLVAVTSAPPQIESFPGQPLPLSPLDPSFGTRRPPLSRRMTPDSSHSGETQSLPCTPAVLAPDPAFLSASSAAPRQNDTAAPSSTGLRARLSMHQRLRSLFTGQQSQRASLLAPPAQLGKVDQGSERPSPTGHAQPAHAQRRSRQVTAQSRLTDPTPAAGASTLTSPTDPPAPSPSRRSSMLKRSSAYTSFARALNGKPAKSPPISPALHDFGELLARGLPGSAAPPEPVHSSLNIPFIISRPVEMQHLARPPIVDITNVKPANSAASRILRKVSSNLLGRGRPPRNSVNELRPVEQGRPRSLSAVPTLLVDSIDATDPEHPLQILSSLEQYPLRTASGSTASYRSTAACGWRRNSLSIDVPTYSTAQTSILSPRGPRIGGEDYELDTPRRDSFASAMSRPSMRDAGTARTSWAPPSSSASHRSLCRKQRDLEIELKKAELQNRILRAELEAKDGELVILRRREKSLSLCIENGNQVVRELSAEREELEEEIRRLSFDSRRKTTSSLGDLGREVQEDWLGASRHLFADEDDA